jgi:F0F1-type ATP synthase assembly protein I
MPRPMPSPKPTDRPEGWGGLGTGWAITTTMLAGILVWGGVGFLIDRLVWSSLVFTAIGIVVGAGAGTYIVYLRYGRGDR